MALILLAILLLASCVAAREPKVGDYVIVKTSDGTSYWGNITSLNNNLLCMTCRYASTNDEMYWWNVTNDVCIGIGSITQLSWPNKIVP